MNVMKPIFVWERLSSGCLNRIPQFGTYRLPTNGAVWFSFVLVILTTHLEISAERVFRLECLQAGISFHFLSPTWISPSLSTGFVCPITWFAWVSPMPSTDFSVCVAIGLHLNRITFVGFCDRSFYKQIRTRWFVLDLGEIHSPLIGSFLGT